MYLEKLAKSWITRTTNLSCYHDTLIDLGKSYCVEVLMLGVLKYLSALFADELLKIENYP